MKSKPMTKLNNRLMIVVFFLFIFYAHFKVETKEIPVEEDVYEENIKLIDSHYRRLDYKIFHHKNLPDYQDIYQLKNQAVAVFKGDDELIEFLKELYKDINLIEIKDSTNLIESIKKGGIQIFVASEPLGIYIIERAGAQDDFQYSKVPIFTEEYLSHGAKKEQPPQVELPVEYDSNLSDPFFDSIKWSYPWYIIEHDDGTIEDTTGEIKNKKDAPRFINTASCVTEHQGEHVIKYCQAKLRDDGIIDIYIHDFTASTNDNLKIRIKNRLFSCQYWTTYVGDRGDEDITWTTTKQKLILNKEEYKRGDIIKGKIVFECVQEVTNPKYSGCNPKTIKIAGVFKPKLR